MAKTLTKLESMNFKLKQREEELAWVHSMYRYTPDELDNAQNYGRKLRASSR